MLRPGQAAPEYLTACDTPMGEGWSVQTRTRTVQEMRQLQMEMIMADRITSYNVCYTKLLRPSALPSALKHFQI